MLLQPPARAPHVYQPPNSSSGDEDQVKGQMESQEECSENIYFGYTDVEYKSLNVNKLFFKK
jgi:hypothetical protein